VFQRLLHCQLPAGAPDNVQRRSGVHELEAVAERASLANHRQHVNIAEGQREFQTNDFAHGDFDAQHGGDPRFAEVDGVAPNHRAVAGIDADGYFDLEPAMTASVHFASDWFGRVHFTRIESARIYFARICLARIDSENRARSELTMLFHVVAPRTRTVPDPAA